MNLEYLFPKQADNVYHGHRLARWVLMIYVFKSFLAGFIHMFAADGGARSIASVALDQFTQGGADSVVTMFGLWGMEQLIIGLIALVILWRYQSLIPMMWGVYSLEYFLRWASHFYTPGLVTENMPPGAALDYLLVPLALAMLILSLWSSSN